MKHLLFFLTAVITLAVSSLIAFTACSEQEFPAEQEIPVVTAEVVSPTVSAAEIELQASLNDYTTAFFAAQKPSSRSFWSFVKKHWKSITIAVSDVVTFVCTWDLDKSVKNSKSTAEMSNLVTEDSETSVNFFPTENLRINNEFVLCTQSIISTELSSWDKSGAIHNYKILQELMHKEENQEVQQTIKYITNSFPKNNIDVQLPEILLLSATTEWRDLIDYYKLTYPANQHDIEFIESFLLGYARVESEEESLEYVNGYNEIIENSDVERNRKSYLKGMIGMTVRSSSLWFMLQDAEEDE